MIKIFSEDASGNSNPNDKRFKWEHLPYSARKHYNFLLNKVGELDRFFIPPLTPDPDKNNKVNVLPSYYNSNFCLALGRFVPVPVAEVVAAEKITKPSDISSSIQMQKRGDCVSDVESATEGLQNCRPFFEYKRQRSTDEKKGAKDIDLNLTLNGLSFGSVVWLYYYERMGIFKILGTLMDDYNYRGKYPISNAVTNSGFANTYSTLMENISLLYRMGISSNLRDRICLYQRTLGVDLESNLDVKSERNEGFMRTFNRLIDYMLEYYKAKQLAQAIQSSTATSNGIRSSVATQTSIRDTMQVLQQQFEAFEYGRNPINTFFGIATVYTTLCLLRLIKDEIGIPRQYERPEEFVPAAFEILVMGRPVTPSESNRFIIYDNCATYGYRLLNDLELINLNLFTTAAQNSPLDQWLDDVEGLVEGYRNAYSAVPEPATAIAV